MDTNNTDSRPTMFAEGGIQNSRISTKPKPGAAWKDTETQVIPENRLGIVFIGVVTSMALAALDQTIVSTALPTIVVKLGGGSLYSWVGTAYLLGAAAPMPIYGKLSEITGSKPILLASILLFLTGSALCGAAQSMIWLILCRFVQGMGGGGILSLVPIVVSGIVPLETRGRYGGMIGIVWGISCVSGPLLGGAFTDHVSWRWCFWINLPIGGVAAAVLFVFLNLNPPKPTTFREEVKSFDFIGIFLLLGGVVCILIGFNYSEISWSSARTIALVAVGGALLIVGGVYEMYTTKAPILPPRLFKTRTTVFILLSNVVQSMVLLGSTYYLPMYYQALGSSATGSGVRMIPYSVGNTILSAVSGVVVTATGSYRPVIWFCWALTVLSFGLMTSLSDTSNNAMMEVYPMLLGMGLGPLYVIPMLALQAAMPIKDTATVTAAFTFMRTVAASVAIALVQTIITTTLKAKINKIPNTSNFDTSPTALMQAVIHLRDIPNAQLRIAVIHAYAQSISTVWIVMAAMTGVAGIMTLFLKGYSLKSNVQVVQGNTNNRAKEADSEATSSVTGSPVLDDSGNSDSVGLKPVR